MTEKNGSSSAGAKPAVDALRAEIKQTRAWLACPSPDRDEVLDHAGIVPAWFEEKAVPLLRARWLMCDRQRAARQVVEQAKPQPLATLKKRSTPFTPTTPAKNRLIDFSESRKPMTPSATRPGVRSTIGNWKRRNAAASSPRRRDHCANP